MIEVLGGIIMKRIEIIKKKLCDVVENCYIGNFEKLVFELQDSETFGRVIMGYLNEFNLENYNAQSDAEMAEIIRGGEYSRQFIKWINEELQPVKILLK